MRRAKPILGFLCRFVIVFGLLAAPWPGWPETYARCVQKCATTVYGSFPFKGIVWYDQNRVGDKADDTMVNVTRRKRPDGQPETPPGACNSFNSRVVVYFPTVFLMALVLATGFGWRRRLRALAWGLVWIHLFMALLLGVMIVSLIGCNPWLEWFEVPPFLTWFSTFLYSLFFTRQAALFAVAVSIWIAVTFRRDDWIKFLGDNQAGDAKRIR